MTDICAILASWLSDDDGYDDGGTEGSRRILRPPDRDTESKWNFWEVGVRSSLILREPKLGESCSPRILSGRSEVSLGRDMDGENAGRSGVRGDENTLPASLRVSCAVESRLLEALLSNPETVEVKDLLD